MSNNPCAHAISFQPKFPSLNQAVHREECTQCFDSQDSELGLDVCLTCFNGGCPSGSHFGHAATHASQKSHPLVVNIRRIPKPLKQRDDEPPSKKLAIHDEPSDEEKYEWKFVVKCYSCSSEGHVLSESESEKFNGLITAIMSARTTEQASQVKAWENEIVPCEHTRNLSQGESHKLEESGLAKCLKCDLTNNLWLCLTCGSLGCGRKQFGGLSGNGHALTHFEETGHPVSVKLGTIEPEGTADIYCYACNDERTDPELAKHLENFGIIVSDQVKVEKNLTELNVEQNMKFDFAMTGEDGHELEPLTGPGLTGLKNLGNSCYMASVLQTLFSLPAFADRYYNLAPNHTCSEPANCVECQMRKVADGLLSGRYSYPHKQHPREGGGYVEDDEPKFQEGLRPYAFKQLIGKGHEEFQTNRQQDADEFLRHFLGVLEKSSKNDSSLNDISGIFKHNEETKLKCTECGGVRIRTSEDEAVSVPVPAVEEEAKAEAMDTDDDESAKKQPKYKPINIKECFDLLTSPHTIEYNCPKCSKKVEATQTTRFSTFPNILAVHARRFTLMNWVPTKMDVPIQIDQDGIVLDKYIGNGKAEGEEELPDDDDKQGGGLPDFNDEAMQQLEAMGFPTVRCQKALLATGNSDAETAMNWLFEHMEDPTIDDPIDLSTAGDNNTSSNADEGQISMLCEMGFTPNQARKALRECGGDPNGAVEWLFSNPDDPGEEAGATTEQSSIEPKTYGSKELPAKYKLKAFISHKGPSVHSGHYVAHIRKDNGWVLFNDEKVVGADGGAQSAEALAPYAYVYIFERQNN